MEINGKKYRMMSLSRDRTYVLSDESFNWWDLYSDHWHFFPLSERVSLIDCQRAAKWIH